MSSLFLQRLAEKVIIADGAMGTTIQSLKLGADDFGGLEGCNEQLVLTRPDLVKEIHAGFLAAGADLIETNSLGANPVVLSEYGIADQAFALAKRSAQLARKVADDFTSSSWPRFVSGSVGPTSKLLTLRHISFDELYQAYLVQSGGLLAGGVDLLQIETCQDILQVKCAVIAALDAMQQAARKVPLCVTLTVDANGLMLLGTELSAALVVLESLPVDIVGLNCATGPEVMAENVRLLSRSSTRPIAILPNAGLPRSEKGQAVYDLSPCEFAGHLERFVKEYGVSMVGGCCGTTPEHIKEVYARLGGAVPGRLKVLSSEQVSSTFSAVALDQEGGSPLIIDERCNANGSKRFRELLLKEDWEGIVEMAKELGAEGAHVLDVCTAYTGRDEVHDLREVLSRLALQVATPLMIDSTQVEAVEAGLKVVGGRCIINSINLEEGEEKLNRICVLAKRFGAVLVALTIDEEGMARNAGKKLQVAKRIWELCTKRHGLPAEWLIFDPLTFTLAAGDEESRHAAVETLQAVKLIKHRIAGSRTILGVSNVSYGLKPYPRQVLNSVFLAEALKCGLDAAIVHSKKIVPLNKIPAAVAGMALDLIYDRRRSDYDPLFEFVKKLEGVEPPDPAAEEKSAGPIEELLKERVLMGRKAGIEALLDEARKKYSPLEIVNILLEGMRKVGALFGSGGMQLPFVLQAAETVKKGVSYLQRFMDKTAGPASGCMVLATVRGDVHDIGKNLVDIILSNNGYFVVNLGVKQPLESILAACERHRPDAIGMSGLLVRSCQVMKENLSEMARRGIAIPVICGGAALNRAYVESELQAAYSTGKVYYGADAFSGLELMDHITGRGKTRRGMAKEEAVTPAVISLAEEERLVPVIHQVVRSKTAVLDEVPRPPFWGCRYVRTREINMAEVFLYINRRSLFALQWMYRRGKGKIREYAAFIREHVEPLFHQWCQRSLERGWLEPAVAYGYFPCQSCGNQLIIYSPEDQGDEICWIEFPRQASGKRLCLADYFLPRGSKCRDVVAFQVVTAGAKASQVCRQLFESNQYSDYLHFHGLSVEFTEALAEYWHRRVRHELGISSQDGATIDSLLRQNYRGERFSFGYPACPNLEDQRFIFDLLKPEAIGVSLSAEFQLIPEQSTTALIVHHPEACYFSIG